MTVCKECNISFESEKSFRSHLRKHKLKVKDYYEKHYPKTCLQTGKKIQWKDGDVLQSYLSRNFVDKTALNQYFTDTDKYEDKKVLLLKYLEESVGKHGVVPCQAELVSLPCSPNLIHYIENFNFAKRLAELNYKSRFNYDFDYVQPLCLPKINPDDLTICIDTREQQPYRFFSSIVGKISEGDYALAGQLYNDVSVERKSIADFGGTVVGGNERFRRELDRVRANNKYLIVLVEFNLHDLYKHKFYGYSNPALVAHNMRNLFRDYSDCCQFVFGGDRASCVKYVVEFLLYGKKCANVDLQLYVDFQKNAFKTHEFTKSDLLNLYANSR